MKNFKNPKQKLFLLLIIISSLFLFLPTTNSYANMLNKFKKGFYFEKYKTAEEAKTELLKLHPIGSDVDTLVKTLEAAGKKFFFLNRTKFDLQKFSDGTEILGFQYRKSTFPGNGIEYRCFWFGGVLYKTSDKKIIEVSLDKRCGSFTKN